MFHGVIQKNNTGTVFLRHGVYSGVPLGRVVLIWHSPLPVCWEWKARPVSCRMCRPNASEILLIRPDSSANSALGSYSRWLTTATLWGYCEELSRVFELRPRKGWWGATEWAKTNKHGYYACD